MNFPRIGRKWIPSFLKKRREEESLQSGEDHFLYEFEISSNAKSLENINSIILLNPYSLMIKPVIKLDDGKAIVSFFVLNKKEGTKVRDTILQDLEQSKTAN